MASAAIPSPRPTKPMPSPVVNFTFTSASGTPSAPASRSRIEARWAAQPRRLAHHHGVDVPRDQAALVQQHAHLAQQVEAVGVAPALVGVREVSTDVVEPAAQQGVDHRVR